MAEQSSATASKENQDWVVFFDRIQAFSTAKGKDRDVLRNEIIRIAQRLKFNDKQTDSLNKILDTPGTAGATLVTSMLELAKTRGQQQQDLLKKMAEDAYQFSAKQGHAIAGMASLYQTLASLARVFGMEDGAAYLEEMAAKDTVRANTFLTDQRGKLVETGQAALSQGYKEAFEALLNSNAFGIQAELGNRAQGVSPILPDGATGAASSTPRPSAARSSTAVTVADFRRNLVDMNVPSAQVDRVIAQVADVAKKSPGGSPDAIDATVEMKLLPSALKKAGLSDGQRKDLYSRLNLPEPQPS